MTFFVFVVLGLVQLQYLWFGTTTVPSQTTTSTSETTTVPIETTTAPFERTALPLETTRSILSEAKDCKEIKSSDPNAPSGVYRIKTTYGELEVFCQNDVDGGGWTVLQKRFNGSVSFGRSWSQYANGFGSFHSEFWLGLEHVHQFTKNKNNELRVDVESFSGRKAYAKYNGFKISNSTDKYRLSLNSSSYNGDAGDGMSHHNGAMFSTRDADNDSGRTWSCSHLGGFGGNWFWSCQYVNGRGQHLNGEYGDTQGDGVQGWLPHMRWVPFQTTFGENPGTSASRIMFRSVD